MADKCFSDLILPGENVGLLGHDNNADDTEHGGIKDYD